MAAAPFPTSADLFVRVKNDPFVFNHLCQIGYFDGRKQRVLFSPLNEWKTVEEGGDVPWHRVHQFMYDGQVMWDRATRVCTVAEVREANKRIRKISYGSLSLVTFNVFNDRADRRSFGARQEDILEFVRGAVAEHDFVLLQEVPEEFLPLLTGLGVGMASTAGTEHLQDHLAILSSRHDMVDSQPVVLGRAKCFLTADFFCEDMSILRLANVHLTSGMQTDSASKRMEQLLEVVKHVSGRHAIIGGDFNERELLSVRGFADCLAPHASEMDRFATINPATNRFATGVPGAVDRVLTSRNFVPQGLRVLTDVVLSDHHPLTARVELRDVIEEDADAAAAHGAGAGAAAGALSDRTALCIVIPFQFWPEIQAARPAVASGGAGASAKVERWMPHLTVSLGFLPEDEFFIIESRLAALLATYLPLDISFGTASVFSHDSTHTVVMEVDDASRKQLRLMRDALASVIRLEHSGGSRGEAYRPHLSIERCPSLAEAEKVVRRIGTSLSFSFTCRKLCMVSREATAHMRVANTVGDERPDTAIIDAVIAAHCGQIRGMGSTLLAGTLEGGAGSVSDASKAAPVAAALSGAGAARATAGVGGAAADIDLQVRLKAGHAADEFARALETCGEVLLVKPLTTKYGRLLRLYTKSPALSYDIHLHKDAEGELQPSGMDLVMDKATALGKQAELAACLHVIKARLRACRVYGQRYGFIPGYGIAIMTYRMLAAGRLREPDTCVADFCAMFGGMPAPMRICNPAKSFPDSSSRFITIQDMCAPGENILRTVTTSSFDKLRRALLSGLDPHASLLAEAGLHPYKATITISAPTLRSSDAAVSWFGSSFLTLVLKLEKSGPVSHDDDWSPLPATPDYPFSWSFTLRSSTALVTRAEDVFVPMQSQFYGLFERCAFIVEYGGPGT